MNSNRTGRMLVGALAFVIIGGMYVSWVALSATERQMGGGHAADVYPIVVDGLVAIAVAASLILRGAEGHRWAIGTVIAYTTASLVLNAAHGAAASGATAQSAWETWGRVLVATSLPVLSTAIGTHLVVKVLNFLTKRAAADSAAPTSTVTPDALTVGMIQDGWDAAEEPAPIDVVHQAAPEPEPEPTDFSLKELKNLPEQPAAPQLRGQAMFSRMAETAKTASAKAYWSSRANGAQAPQASLF